MVLGPVLVFLFDKNKRLLWLSAGGLALLLVAHSVTVVPTGYTGVKSVFGQISETPASQGINLKLPFIQKVELVNNKQQVAEVDGQIWGETSEKIQVYGEEVLVTYQIMPEKSAWLYANVTGGTKNLIMASDVASAIKSAMETFPATEVTVRNNIEPLAQKNLNEALADKYGEGAVRVIRLVIQQMDFEPEYNEAIQQKSIAIQKQQQQVIENETNIEKAKADKQVAITNAEARKETTIAIAKAEAEAKRIQAEAEAEANRKLDESLTDAVLKNQFYEKWDGKLPSVMGEGTVVTSIEP